ncbi:PD-(D/E)XK nuclease superfamily protein [Anaerohalosphaera lusitana]|uniref:PD-(D/E)XK nuclease superfamily protein n=1 Tax=Anaerohalosphaera lusitana TaxID=1936003 RepID=A0A1U9NQE7_9BACT|nr:PD-(D/E)XK nuclease family protein [Anaerohalosphaera lusitana]AQT70045.1 PD-(D/E)XK nuclease superfamily protein [Anaerohalosphaera lusitana]
MEQIIKISAKNLGALALEDHCPKCFYLKLRMGFKLPYQIFPGIFSSIDSYSKKITWGCCAKNGKVPQWFDSWGEFVKPVPAPHHSKFNYTDQKTGIKLTGVPDDIFLMEDGRYFIVDYKTAKYTGNQDALLPMYQVQLNGYAYIFEKLGMGEVGGIGLCYYEPQGNAPVEQGIGNLLEQDGFVMPFRAYLKRLELDPDGVLSPLLKQVRSMWDGEQVPAGKEGCKDCKMLGEMVKFGR